LIFDDKMTEFSVGLGLVYGLNGMK